ncbi:GAF and ANTAR domain-containing protein [Desulfosarcina sp. OttesenSCG-928-A07]|nr:GAF and ANTAR domain-containing protein [Desulfosarcina sp. OttesenSCG-928-A07]
MKKISGDGLTEATLARYDRVCHLRFFVIVFEQQIPLPAENPGVSAHTQPDEKRTHSNFMPDTTNAHHEDYIKALMNISQAISSDLFLEDLLKLIVMVVAKVTEVNICSLWLVDEEVRPPQIRLKATQAIEPAYVIDRSLGLGEGVVGYVVTHQQPLMIPDVLQCEIFKEKKMAQTLGLVSMAGVPLQVKKDKTIGALNCFTTTPHTFSETDIHLLTTVANQAALAILNTELIVKTKVIQEELKSRKTIERAKEIIMERNHLSGDEAYRWIQKRSMDMRKTMMEVSEAILLSRELF